MCNLMKSEWFVAGHHLSHSVFVTHSGSDTQFKYLLRFLLLLRLLLLGSIAGRSPIMWYGPHHMIYIDFDFGWWQCNVISATVCEVRTTQSAFIEEERFFLFLVRLVAVVFGEYFIDLGRQMPFYRSTMETTNSNFRINFTMTVDDRSIERIQFSNRFWCECEHWTGTHLAIAPHSTN